VRHKNLLIQSLIVICEQIQLSTRTSTLPCHLPLAVHLISCVWAVVFAVTLLRDVETRSVIAGTLEEACWITFCNKSAINVTHRAAAAAAAARLNNVSCYDSYQTMQQAVAQCIMNLIPGNGNDSSTFACSSTFVRCRYSMLSPHFLSTLFTTKLDMNEKRIKLN